MEQVEFPDEGTWDARRQWFEDREAERSRAGAPAPSEQACALMIDLQAIFCAGAWAAVVMLAAVIVDSQAREARSRDPEIAETGRRGDVPGLDRGELRWLRDLRNRLVHEDRDNPAISIEDQWTRRKSWERHGRRAVEAAFAALYPGEA